MTKPISSADAVALAEKHGFSAELALSYSYRHAAMLADHRQQVIEELASKPEVTHDINECISGITVIGYSREAVAIMQAKIEQANCHIEGLEQLRPAWAQGYSRDSIAAQASWTAITQLWAMLGVSSQTDAVQKLEQAEERVAELENDLADMFWNSDDAERQHGSIEEFLNDEICNGSIEVGAEFTIWQARKLPSVKIRVTGINDESCEAEYEVIDAAMKQGEHS